MALPSELVSASPGPQQGLFLGGVDRYSEEVVAAGAAELGEMSLGLVWELDVGARELIPGTAADRDRQPDCDQCQHRGKGAKEGGVARELEGAAGQPPFTPLGPAQGREKSQGKGDPRQQDQKDRHPLIDSRLVAKVVGEAAARLDS